MRPFGRVRGIAAAIAVAVVAVVVAGCGGGDGSAASSGGGGGGTTLTLGVSGPGPGGNMLQLPIAEAQGYFKQEGITVKPVFLGTSGAVLQALASGKVDIGMSTPDVVLQAIDKGQDVEMVYNWTTKTVTQIGVLPDSPIHSVADLQGKTIGVQELTAGPIQLVKAAAANAGIDPSSLKFVATGVGAPALDALERHRVDAFVTYDTLFAAMTAGTGKTLRLFAPQGVEDLFSSSFVASKSWVQQHQDAVAGFGRAWAKASVFALANPEAGVRMMFSVFPKSKVGKSEEAATKATLSQFHARMQSLYGGGSPPASEQWGAYPSAAVSHWISYAKDNKLITSAPSPNDVYTNSFVKQYNAFDADKIRAAAKAADEGSS